MGWIILLIVIVLVLVGILSANDSFTKSNERNDILKNNLLQIEGFKASKKVVSFKSLFLLTLDENLEQVAYITEKGTMLINFSDIIGVEIIEDGNTISQKSTSRTIGGALVGGVLAGGVGTLLGGLSGSSKLKNKVSSINVKLLLRSLEQPTLTINCFDSRTMTTSGKQSLETEGNMESYIYKMGKVNADEIKDLISVIIDRTDTKFANKNSELPKLRSNSLADEIMKLNDLKEKGILTNDEFLAQKNKLLN